MSGRDVFKHIVKELHVINMFDNLHIHDVLKDVNDDSLARLLIEDLKNEEYKQQRITPQQE